MAFCPLDYRYGCQEFKEIWSELGRHQRQVGSRKSTCLGSQGDG